MKKLSALSRLDFLSPLSVIPGIGPRRVSAFNESGISNVGDLLYRLPIRYIDHTTIIPIATLCNHIDQTVCVKGVISHTQIEHGRKPRFRIEISDDSGSYDALWFAGITYLQKSLIKNSTVFLCGKVSKFTTIQMVHPQVEKIGKRTLSHPWLPHYSVPIIISDAGISQRTLISSIEWLLDNLTQYPRIIPDTIEVQKKFPSLKESLKAIHFPKDLSTLDYYYKRLKYEELYRLALCLRWSKRKFVLPGRSRKAGALIKKFTDQLSFTLTDDQQYAVKKLQSDIESCSRMHTLLQGDVGSGKTVVAFIATLSALASNDQVIWMAPTEVLAEQTFILALQWIKPLGYSVCMLKSGLTSSQRAFTIKSIKNGAAQFIVGTHALLQPSVTFHRAGLIVIDEQHRFGVLQRLTLHEKEPSSDFLLLSATPIPKTLAQTLYGDLDLVSIHSRPVGRKPVSTHIVPDIKRTDMESFIKKEIIENNAQVFHIVPRIDNEENNNSLKDIESVQKRLSEGAFKNIPMAVLHGRINSEDKTNIMRAFKNGTIKILVATTVVEVGIDVADATIIVIENAERFGLSQLHQLRGRVGRSNKAGYAFLFTNNWHIPQTAERLKEFCKTDDGFLIADIDLKLRGPGEVAGLRQHGFNDLKIANILTDADLFCEIQQTIKSLLS